MRAFYDDVIDAHGWQRADITYLGGEWTYLLVDGRTEALIELEVTRGFVEIDLQVSTPEDPAPAPSPAGQTPGAPATPPATPAPPPDDDDDDDGDDSDDDSDDGGSDDSGG